MLSHVIKCNWKRNCSKCHKSAVRVNSNIYVYTFNNKISVIQFRSLAYKCFVVVSAAETVVQIRTVW